MKLKWYTIIEFFYAKKNNYSITCLYSCLFYTFQLTAKIDKLSNESEDLRSKKRELESNVRKLENDMETVSQSNSELVIDFTKKNFFFLE